MKKDKIKNFLVFNVVFVFAVLYIYRTYIFKSEGFEIYYDYLGQHIPFYEEFFRLIKSGEIGWSWNNFLGNNFYGSKGYYMIGDALLGYVM